MTKPKIVRIKDRIDNLTNYLIKETKIPKIKYAFRKEYESGNFYSIPKWLYVDGEAG